MNTIPSYGSNSYGPSYPAYPSYIPPNSPFQPSVIQPSLINGRSVNSVEEITAGEVPLNGSLAVFPKSDGSMIYVKSTNGNGTIDTKYYVLAPEDFVENSAGSEAEPSVPAISNQDIMAAILNIQNQVDTLQTLIQKQPRNNKQYNQNRSKEGMKHE